MFQNTDIKLMGDTCFRCEETGKLVVEFSDYRSTDYLALRGSLAVLGHEILGQREVENYDTEDRFLSTSMLFLCSLDWSDYCGIEPYAVPEW